MDRRGPALLRWRRKVAASVGAVLLDDLPEPASLDDELDAR
jgi:hypothetical protein